MEGHQVLALVSAFSGLVGALAAFWWLANKD